MTQNQEYAVEIIAFGVGLVLSGVLILAVLGLLAGDCGCGESGSPGVSVDG